ncbi:MAG: hypothetical protein VX463_02380 [Pseudomonadota bacterium]|nr:hypothetical protein [Pseudomonadota bacterium]
MFSAKAHLKHALEAPRDEGRIKDALALLAEAEKRLAQAEDPTPDALETQLIYAHVPLFSPTIKPDRLDVALPDGLIALRPTTAAAALLVKVVIEGEALQAIIPLRAAASLRDALTAMISEAASCRMADAAAPEAAR